MYGTSSAEAIAILLEKSHITQKDILNLRLVDKEQYTNTAKMLHGPYQSRSAFYLANKTHLSSRSKLFEAWRCYKKAISIPCGAAIFYKLSERHFMKSYPFLVDDGRIYGPKKHSWNSNLGWVLGLIHTSRSVQLFSSLKNNYAKRKTNRHEYSALAKEVTCVFKSGYQLYANPNGTLFFTLDKKVQSSIIRKLTMDDIDPTNSDIERMLKLVRAQKIYKQRFYENSPGMTEVIVSLIGLLLSIIWMASMPDRQASQTLRLLHG